MPFKCIQIDKSYRAERPQKGRMREFVQCDIDILGSDSPLCELELIHTTAAALLKLDIGSFTIKINDRRVLKGVLHNIGIADDMMDSVCITLDKWDKIGTEGVMKELGEKEVSAESCEKIASLLEGGCTIDQAEQLCGEPTYIEQLKKIIAEVLNVDEEEITMETTFVDDLGADSLDIFQIIMGIEEEFDIEIANEDAEHIVTVSDAVEQIKNALNS